MIDPLGPTRLGSTDAATRLPEGWLMMIEEDHSPPAADVFEVRVTGNIPDDVLEQLAHVDVTTRELRTALRGHFRDQAELHGFLVKLRSLGLDVVEVRRLATPNPDHPVDDDP